MDIATHTFCAEDVRKSLNFKDNNIVNLSKMTELLTREEIVENLKFHLRRKKENNRYKLVDIVENLQG